MTRAFVQALVRSERASHCEGEAERIAAQSVPVLLSMRDVERVGDHGANIGARVFHMVTGSTKHL